jgi:hypothetical protein
MIIDEYRTRSRILLWLNEKINMFVMLHTLSKIISANLRYDTGYR